MKRFLGRFGVAALVVTALSAGFAGATEQRTAHASVGRTSLLVGGEPFFPVMLLDQCDASAAARAKALGVNLVVDEHCDGASAKSQLSALRGGQLGVLPIGQRSASGDRLAGWTYPDEPENNGWTAPKLAARFGYRRGSADGLLSFVTTTSAFFKPSAKVSRATVGAIARLADVAGFDLYPLNRCDRDLGEVYDAQRSFVDLVGSMPTFQWIETGPLDSTYCGGFTMSPAQLTAEAWLAVAGGARGIGFFTQTLAPAAKFNVSAPVQTAIARFASTAAKVRPGLVGQTVASSADSGEIKILARRAGNTTYVFVVNASSTFWIHAQMRVPALANSSLKVFGENRAVKIDNHNFIDAFPPLGVHVYVQTG